MVRSHEVTSEWEELVVRGRSKLKKREDILWKQSEEEVGES